MSSEINYAKQAIANIDNPDIQKALNFLCKAISNLERENEALKNEIRNVRIHCH